MAASAEKPRLRTITVSATYGAGGSIIAPRLAERVGLPFLDRLVPALASGSGEGGHEPTCGEGLNDEERAQTPLSRWVSHLVRLPSVVGTPVPGPESFPDRDRLRKEAEASIDKMVSRSGAVLLGRAGAVVLAGHPSAFHIRLDGPADRRVAQAMSLEHIDEPAARQRQSEADRARRVYVQRLYDRDSADPALYHVVLDSTALALAACVDLLATAALAFWDQALTTG
jgi:cytidylate kinase